MREKFFANIVFESMDAVENKSPKPASTTRKTRKLSDPSPLSHGLLIIYRWRIGMRYCYSHLYGIPQTGLRFFTVYGPWGRPDMALYLFTEAILEGRPIDVFQRRRHETGFHLYRRHRAGRHRRARQPAGRGGGVPHRLDNIGNQRPEPLMRLIAVLETASVSRRRSISARCNPAISGRPVPTSPRSGATSVTLRPRRSMSAYRVSWSGSRAITASTHRALPPTAEGR